MGPPKLLIAGRGPLAILGARVATARGYAPTLLFDPAPFPPFLLTGEGVGPSSGILGFLLREAGFPDSRLPEARDGGESRLLYFGKTHRMLGCPLPAGGLSSEEEERFFSGLRLLGESVFPESENRMKQSYRVTSTRFPWNKRLLNWILEPERKKEDLPGSLRKVAESVLGPWSAFLSEIRPFAGLSQRKSTDAELIRVLMHLSSARTRVIRAFRDLFDVEQWSVETSVPGVPFVTWEGRTLDVTKSGSRWTVSGGSAAFGPQNSFDRVLSLSAPPEFPLGEGACPVIRSAVPSFWPSGLLMSGEGGSSFLIRSPGADPDRREGRLIFSKTSGEGAESWVERWNGHSLQPFLFSGQIRHRHVDPLLAVSPGSLSPPRNKTPYLKVAGNYAEMTDPSVIPVVTEDWLADLSMALPSRTASS